MPSVTDLAKAFSGPQESLVEWANRVGLEGKTLAQARSAPQSDGNRLHAELQRLVRGEPLLDAADDAVIALAEWWSDASAGMVAASAETPLRAVVETPLGDVEVWGRADVLVHRAAATTVWDAKVGRKPFIGLDNVLQVTIYQAIFDLSQRDRLTEPVDVEAGIVRLSPDGALRVVEAPYDAGEAVEVLRVAAFMWRAQDDCRRAASGIRR
jgi:hypothetical protein